MRPVDPGEPTHLFHWFFNRKIILKFIENPRDPVFCRKTPIVYFIYVLGPAILQNTSELS
jgi:hypothetical protein